MNHAQRRILIYDLLKLLRATRMNIYDISAELDVSLDTVRAWCHEGEAQGVFVRARADGNLIEYTLARAWGGLG